MLIQLYRAVSSMSRPGARWWLQNLPGLHHARPV